MRKMMLLLGLALSLSCFSKTGKVIKIPLFPVSIPTRVSAAQGDDFIWSTVVSNISRAYRCSTAKTSSTGNKSDLPDAPLTTAASRRRPMGRNLCTYHPLQQRYILHDYHQRVRQRQLPCTHYRPAWRMVRTRMAQARRYRPVPLF